MSQKSQIVQISATTPTAVNIEREATKLKLLEKMLDPDKEGIPLILPYVDIYNPPETKKGRKISNNSSTARIKKI